MRRSYPTPSTELLASDTSSIEGGPPFSAEPHGWGISDEHQWGMSASAVDLAFGGGVALLRWATMAVAERAFAAFRCCLRYSWRKPRRVSVRRCVLSGRYWEAVTAKATRESFPRPGSKLD
jgi:hypothetical protein